MGLKISVVCACLMTLTSVTCFAQDPSGPDYSPVIESVNDPFVKQLRGERIAGAAIAAVADGQTIWTQGYGYGNAKSKRLVSSSTPFYGGDLTKLFTAIAVLQLVDQGKVELDAPIIRYLPDLNITSRFGDRMPTVAQLLSHHGGLPTNIHANSFVASPPDELVRWESLYLAQPPGDIYSYSHLGYDVAGMLIESVGEMAYADWVTQKILEPLGMRDSGFAASARTAVPHSDRRRVIEGAYGRGQASLGIFVSIRDMAQFMTWYLSDDTNPVLSPDLVARMHTPQPAPLDLDNEVGLAWQMTNTGKHRVEKVLRLNSVTVSYRSILLMAPEHDLGVIVMANASSADEPVQEAARVALDEMIRVKLGLEPVENFKSLPESLALPAGVVDAPMADSYNTPFGEMRFLPDDETFAVPFVGRTFGASRRTDGWYEFSFRLFGMIDLQFDMLAELLLHPAELAGRKVLLSHLRGSTFLFGTAYEPSTEVGGLESWTGDYRLSNPDYLAERLGISEVEVEVERNTLFINYEFPLTITLTPHVPVLPLDTRPDGSGRYYVPGLGANMGDELDLLRVNGQRTIRYAGWIFVED